VNFDQLTTPDLESGITLEVVDTKMFVEWFVPMSGVVENFLAELAREFLVVWDYRFALGTTLVIG
jgi:hypothetical protein